ncbi:MULTISPECIES: hypothetical protein [Streptomyces]|uniref:hypothetical protein n=1 Tax=Streptomyces TaxID=1883 RepID=UPI000B22769A|nr:MULTISPECIES: hypothetical protein [Streptomyces]
MYFWTGPTSWWRCRSHPPVSLHIWAQTGPDTAEGIARVVVDFAAQFLTEDREDVADTLRQMEAAGVGQALDAHPHRRPVRTRCA